MKTAGKNVRVDRFAFGLVLFAAPLVLGAKGCTTAVVGDDNHAEAGADTGMTGGDAGTGGATATGGAPATGGSSGSTATGGSPATGGGGSTATGGAPATGGSSGTGAKGGTGGTSGSTATGGSPATGGSAGSAGKGGTAGSSGSGGGTTCGGLQGLQCAADEYCDFTPDMQCGAADQLGTCKPKPGGCTDQFQPVCGCDGMKYGNACDANMMGVSVAADGACVPVTGNTCGGDTGVTCDAGAFCKYAQANCGLRGDTGTCTAIPDACDAVAQPVCACDGNTYQSECLANMAGQSVVAAGNCDLGSGYACGGLTGEQCPSGEFCYYKPEMQCGAGDQTGLCRLVGGILCSDVVMQVCGCDGKTYQNDCYALVAKTSVTSQGACPTQ